MCAVSVVMDGAGPASAVAIELKVKELEAVMGNSDRADDMENIVERYGNSPDRMRRAAPLSGSAQHARGAHGRLRSAAAQSRLPERMRCAINLGLRAALRRYKMAARHSEKTGARSRRRSREAKS
jgi:hypothetical protein